MKAARCRTCWQPIDVLEATCQKCGSTDTLRVFRTIAEWFLYAIAAVLIALTIWAIIW